MPPVCAGARPLEHVIVPAIEDPDFIRNARGVRAKRDIIALRVHDAFFLALFLFHDVAKNAALFFLVPFARGAQLVEKPSGHEGGGGNLRMSVRAFLAGEGTVILVDGDILEAAVALQILDAMPPGLQDQQNLIVGQILELAVVFGGLDDDFVRAHRLHLVVAPVGAALGIALDAVQRIRVRQHRNLRRALAAGDEEAHSWSSIFSGQNGHPPVVSQVSSRWPTTTQLRVMGSLRSSMNGF